MKTYKNFLFFDFSCWFVSIKVEYSIQTEKREKTHPSKEYVHLQLPLG